MTEPSGARPRSPRVRHLASECPYDDYKPETTSLRANADDVRNTLQAELQAHLQLPASRSSRPG
jgi:hypothetical protein